MQSDFNDRKIISLQVTCIHSCRPLGVGLEVMLHTDIFDFRDGIGQYQDVNAGHFRPRYTSLIATCPILSYASSFTEQPTFVSMSAPKSDSFAPMFDLISFHRIDQDYDVMIDLSSNPSLD